MKKIFSVILCVAVVLTTGCSNVSQDEYNSLVEENTQLKNDIERISDEKNDLAKETGSLQEELDAQVQYLDICTWMLGRPKSSEAKTESKNVRDGLTTESTYYIENSEPTAKNVTTFSSKYKPEEIASFMNGFEDQLEASANSLFELGAKNLISIYRYEDGNVIATFYLYKDKSNVVMHKAFFTQYGTDVANQYDLLNQ